MALVSYAESIAKLAQQAFKKATAKGIKCERMCDTCAFRANQPHTLEYFIAADNAASQLLHGGEFNCHTHDFKMAEKPCAGFKAIKDVFGEDIEEG